MAQQGGHSSDAKPTMIIEEAYVKNYARFRGTHTIKFDAGVYAVTAELKGNEQRSNWLGKTTFMWAMSMFILYGEKMSSHRYEDDWITHDETMGEVFVRYSNGLSIQRTRYIGKATTLIVVNNGVRSTGARAQEEIEAVIGMSKADFKSAYFFEQKMMSAAVNGDSSKLYAKARAWFQLNKLQEAFTAAKKARAGMVKDEATLVLHIANLTDNDAIDLKPFKKQWAADDKKAKALQSELDEVSDWLVRAEHARWFRNDLASVKTLTAEYGQLDPADVQKRLKSATQTVTECKTAFDVANSAATKAEGNASGEWDGLCPVTDNKCPSPTCDSVSAELASSNQLFERTQKALKSRKRSLTDEKRSLVLIEDEKQSIIKVYRALKKARELANARKDDYQWIEENGEPPDKSELKNEVAEAWRDAGASQQRYEQAKRDVETQKQNAIERKAHEVELADVRATMAVQTKSMAVFKRAQRSIAETALNDIERDSNILLSEAGIDLAIMVTWERLIKGLETHCGSCGHSYGKSQRAKKCPDCSTARNQKCKEELEVTPTDRSGAADDLGGIAFQLGAAAWLRRKRQSPWSVAFIDEPFSALDAAHKPALAQQLVSILGSRFGFQQAFITAHDRSVLDALPERFVITADRDGSSF